MIPLIELDEDRDTWIVAEWFPLDYVPKAKVLSFYDWQRESDFERNLLVA